MGDAVDHFAALGVSRGAALDSEAVREAFQKASKSSHPDAGGDGDAFEALALAHATVADPVRRLKHLAELEFGEAPESGGAIANETMALFGTVSTALSSADDFLKRRAGASSAIAKALLAKDESEVTMAVFAANGSVRGRKAELLGALPGVDASLAAGEGDSARARIGELARELAFLAKWEAQLGERLAALAVG